jgi:hypothetical protein
MSRHRIAQWLAATLVGFAASAANADTITDLSGAGASATINGAFFQQISFDPTGTGIFAPFLRVQRTPNEMGYNTDGTAASLQSGFSTKIPDPHTHSVLYSDLLPVQLPSGGPANYYRFTLDIGEPGNISSPSSLITLTQFKLFLGASTVPNNLNAGSNSFGNDDNGIPTNSALVYDLDSGGDVAVTLRDRNSGNGQADYEIFVPVFAAQAGRPQFYLYVQLGNIPDDGNHFSSDGSFEEFSVQTGGSIITSPVPAPPALVLGLVGAAGLFGKRAWARKRMPEMA